MKKLKKIIFVVLVLIIISFPIFSFAQSGGGDVVKTCNDTVENFGDVICKIGDILNTVIPMLIALGVVYFVWGVVTYMIGADEEQKKKGRDKIIYGIIGLVVIVGMWGLVRIVTNSFTLDNTTGGIQTPCVPGTPGCI
jgi:hypothetical protein